MTKKYRLIQAKKETDRTIKDLVYLNCCDCIYYGYGKKAVNRCGIISDFVFNMIWQDAFNDMAEEF